MIEVENLYKRFKRSENRKQAVFKTAPKETVDAVAGVSFTCRPGRIFTLLGPNGAGKTTALRIIASMLKPSSGAVRVAGYDVVSDPLKVRRRLGFLTGATGLYDRMSARETLKYFAELHGLTPQEWKPRVDDLIERLDITDFADRRIGKLSMGQKQRISIARTLVHDPEVIVFDEPTNGLDVLTSRTIIQWIRECRNAGKTVIFSTHIMGEVSLLSDDLAIIHEGRLVYSGEFADFQTEHEGRSLEDAFIHVLENADTEVAS